MESIKNKYQSVTLSRFYLKIVGFWKASSAFEQRMMDLALAYAVVAITIAVSVQSVDLYHCLNDFSMIMDNLSATIILIILLVKLGSFMYYRDLVYDIISYAETNFWEIDYDEYGDKVLKECDNRAVMLTYAFCRVVECGTMLYITAPIMENPHFHKEQRQLPFRLWVDFPVTTSPYYEIIYFIEALATLHSGICTFCFDNFLCCLNIHVAGQFKILAHKLENIADTYLDKVAKNEDEGKAATAAWSTFKNCVSEHLKLVHYVRQMEEAFTWILLGQLLLSSMVICFGGFQFLARLVITYSNIVIIIYIDDNHRFYNTTATQSIPKKCLFTLLFFGSISQLFLYTWTCNDITFQSDELSTAAYNMRWYLLPQNVTGRNIKLGVFMVMNRSSHPCVLTAGTFAPMSLETFRSILGTAASYFTLLQQMSEEDT